MQRHKRAGSIAGKASSTTITRFIVEVVSTTIAPSDVCTRPSRTMPSQPRVCGLVMPGRYVGAGRGVNES
jgi:hypothetical protein